MDLLPSSLLGFLSGSDCKESACNAGDPGLIPGEGNGNPLQYPYLENFMDRGAWKAIVCGTTKGCTRLSKQARFSSELIEFMKENTCFCILISLFHYSYKEKAKNLNVLFKF